MLSYIPVVVWIDVYLICWFCWLHTNSMLSVFIVAISPKEPHWISSHTVHWKHECFLLSSQQLVVFSLTHMLPAHSQCFFDQHKVECITIAGKNVVPCANLSPVLSLPSVECFSGGEWLQSGGGRGTEVQAAGGQPAAERRWRAEEKRLRPLCSVCGWQLCLPVTPSTVQIWWHCSNQVCVLTLLVLVLQR